MLTKGTAIYTKKYHVPHPPSAHFTPKWSNASTQSIWAKFCLLKITQSMVFLTNSQFFQAGYLSILMSDLFLQIYLDIDAPIDNKAKSNDVDPSKVATLVSFGFDEETARRH